jgi:integrase
MPINNALVWALDKRRTEIALRTYNDRVNTLKFITQAISACKFDMIAVRDLKKYHLKEALEKVYSTRDISPTRCNSILECAKMLFNVLVDWDVLEFSIATRIKYLKEHEPTKHLPLTGEELKRVADHLKQTNYPFYVYCKILFRTGIRPLEILSLTPESFDFVRGEIFIRPADSKTKKSRYVPLDNDLKSDIQGIINSCSLQDFLFSAGLTPGPKQWHRNRVSKLWDEIVRKGLKINKTLYSLKHTGADARLVAGNRLEDVQHTFGHGSKAMTQIYARVEKGLIIDRLKEIIPEF